MWKKSDLLKTVKRVIKQDHFMIQDTVAALTHITYRSVRLDEIKTLQAIQKTVYPDRAAWSRYAFLAELNGKHPVHYLVADCQGQLVGFGGIRIEESHAHVTNLAVLPELQGNGIGSELITQLLAFAEGYQVTSITLEVRASNEKAQRLYKSLGFKLSTTKNSYYRDGEDAYLMVLTKEVVGGHSD
ncbi:ribosomal protein S18-alanine N-acetyltransferase [Vagococcus zengguangii]|uniref:Ribosomal-protein-alanine N-acetyltransferase n=1 Tax=Vagococcus zengguangii TaxID=2571750 RepID=A0A4D7CPG9_9ENTE|nr:ribosomal protein S18-alanine N-acetyltransferase [Vagococcus zengguangii]QCI86015.1 ribosomal-protein-alanine N-acetyltransferase [Vagococcus zengguangii]TLG80241.1 ribosomal-protein-alanine N-acetyltransferase [Vagococcus zengguangii]